MYIMTYGSMDEGKQYIIVKNLNCSKSVGVSGC